MNCLLTSPHAELSPQLQDKIDRLILDELRLDQIILTDEQESFVLDLCVGFVGMFRDEVDAKGVKLFKDIYVFSDGRALEDGKYGWYGVAETDTDTFAAITTDVPMEDFPIGLSPVLVEKRLWMAVYAFALIRDLFKGAWGDDSGGVPLPDMGPTVMGETTRSPVDVGGQCRCVSLLFGHESGCPLARK